MSILGLALRRLTDNRLLLAVIFVGVTISTTLVAVGPVFVTAVERLALNLVIDRLRESTSGLTVLGLNLPMTGEEIRQSELALARAINRHLAEAYDGHERYVAVDPYLAGLPAAPLPRPGTRGPTSERGSLRYLTNLEDHVTVVEGRLAGPELQSGAVWPRVEAVISRTTARQFSLGTSDLVTLAPGFDSPTRLLVRIVGIVEATNPTERYWRPHANVFLDPPAVADTIVEESSAVPGNPSIEFDPDRPPIPLLVHEEALADAVEEAFPGSLGDSIWFIDVDAEGLKRWSLDQTQSRLDGFEAEFTGAVPGSEVITGISGVLSDFDRRTFFSRAPLLMLMVIVMATLLFFLAMLVAYRVQSAEADAAMLRSRGVGTAQLLWLYALEGVVMTAIAVALAPFLAVAIVAFAGKLSYFQAMTAGDPLPATLSSSVFLAAFGAGLLCLAIYVVFGALGARGGALVQKLRSSRPPQASFVHRYYFDVGLLVLGGFILWELHARGRIVSGGLFKDVAVNEPLLIAPVLFLLVVGLLFMRIFPLLVRFISAESPALLHLVAAASVLGLAIGIAAGELQRGNATEWLGPVALVLAVGGLYRATYQPARLRLRLAGIVLQAGLVAGFVILEPLDASSLLFAPTLGLISILPGQAAFLALAVPTRVAPVWLSTGLWDMARNPLQYTWLVLLLVMVAGVGILSTTVGGTLEESQKDRIEYQVAGDIRVTDVDGYAPGGRSELKDRYLSVPGVTSVSLALRQHALAGPARIEMLAVESLEFPYISWYRDDFSAGPLSGVMVDLRSHRMVEKIAVPEGADTIGAWVRPEERYPAISLWMVIEDGRGIMTPVSLGRLGEPEWQLVSTRIPPGLKPPLNLVSVQIFEPGLGSVLTRGKLRVDDIHVTVGADSTEHVIEDFERGLRWTPIITSALAPDRILLAADDVHAGMRAGLFSFGEDNIQGVRGFYHSLTGGPIPVVFSSSFVDALGIQEGDVLIAEVAERRLPVVHRGTVRYFPTMDPGQDGFMLADLDNILWHLNILAHQSPISPNELFLAEAPADHKSVRDALAMLTLLSGQVMDRAEQLETVRTDPLSTAGWRSMVLLSLGVVVLVASLGYLTYLLSFFHRRKGEMGFLKSMGLSRRQTMGLLGFEQLSVAVIGLGLGTWAGFQMSRIMVSSVALTERGQPVLPPFRLVTDWGLVLPTYLALLVVFAVTLLVLDRTIARLDLQAIARVEGG